MENKTKCYCGHTDFCDCGPLVETLEDIKLEEVTGSTFCAFSVIENKLVTLYKNQEQILKAIKLLNNGK